MRTPTSSPTVVLMTKTCMPIGGVSRPISIMFTPARRAANRRHRGAPVDDPVRLGLDSDRAARRGAAQTCAMARSASCARPQALGQPPRCDSFIYGLPFAALALAVIWALGEARLPEPNMRFLGWVACDAIAQLLAAMRRRSFVVAVANAKTEVLQVALLSTLVLAEPPSGRQRPTRWCGHRRSRACRSVLGSPGASLVRFA